MDTVQAFALALKKLRKARKMSQEDFLTVCSQGYISQLERGLNNPTLGMVDELANQMQLHPLTLLLKTYSCRQPELSLEELMFLAINEIRKLEDPPSKA
nr:helix-turn-helix transcriptional regulator [uncultured Deefgea sp.]